ncbi:MAG: hypothetical protein K1X79_11740 [Oligoflexia bacterium]|nr:hypothetical protein [Oligoflexia bacterium]
MESRLLPLQIFRTLLATFAALALFLASTSAEASPIRVSRQNFKVLSIPRVFRSQTVGRALGCYLRPQGRGTIIGWLKRGDEKDRRVDLQAIKSSAVRRDMRATARTIQNSSHASAALLSRLQARLALQEFLLNQFLTCVPSLFSSGGEAPTATPTIPATPTNSESGAVTPAPTATSTPTINPTSSPTPSSGNPSVSITRGEITWTLRRPISSGPGSVSQGTFITGDPWVVGPVEILSINPGSAISAEGYHLNGSMVNPTYFNRQPGDLPALQGYDGRAADGNPAGTIAWLPPYSAALNVARNLPFTLSAGNSLVSVKSRIDFSNTDQKTGLQAASVLTILSSAPASGSFRPPYAGNDKTVRFNESQLQWNQLQQIPLVSGAPSAASLASGFSNFWLDWGGWNSRMLHPIANMPEYGRDLASLIGEAAVLVNMNIPQNQKRPLVLALVQMGIDFYANVVNGARWGGTGGQCSGRKLPILFAGAMLGDTSMLQVGFAYPSYRRIVNGQVQNASVFGEDSQTFRVEETSPGSINFQSSPSQPQHYSSAHLTLPEWGFSHTDWPVNDNRFWDGDPYRRCCTANAWVGNLLAARLMGLKANWNNDILFDYQDRFMAVQLERIINSPSTDAHWHRSWSSWVEQAWDTYRAGLGGVWQCPLASNVCRGQ